MSASMSAAFSTKSTLMSFYYVAVILGFSIIIPATIGLIRLPIIERVHRPFIIYCILDLLNHTLSAVLIEMYGSNTINSNIFVLIEAILIAWQFKEWGSFKGRRNLFYGLITGLVIIWVIDNLVLHSLTSVNSFYRIVYSFVLVFLSIEQMNVMIFTSRKSLLINAAFMICTGIAIYYTYKATVEVFFLIKLKGSMIFYSNIFKILVFVNLIANLIFGWAVLWIPRKQRFISPH
jgi:hypothetical protein